MTQKPDGGPAYPRENNLSQLSGMSLRDYFAGQALANDWCKIIDGDDWSDTAEDAYRLADAMIAVREQGK